MYLMIQTFHLYAMYLVVAYGYCSFDFIIYVGTYVIYSNSLVHYGISIKA